MLNSPVHPASSQLYPIVYQNFQYMTTLIFNVDSDHKPGPSISNMFAWHFNLEIIVIEKLFVKLSA